ncbi:MAG: efflux RND transporter periplasmic adaptor subunit [Thermoguttaceae bacterium]
MFSNNISNQISSYKSVLIQSTISLVLIAATLTATASLIGFRRASEASEERSAIPLVEVVPVEQHLGGIDFPIDGEVIPFRNLKVAPEIQGRVIFKSENCRPGRSVQAGEVLIRIDPADFELEIKQLTETVAQAEVNISENNIRKGNIEKALKLSKEQLAIREGELKRYESSTLPGAYSSAELDSVKLSLLNCQNSVLQLENELSLFDTQKENYESALRRSNASLEIAKLNLERTNVKAPISGIITSDSVEVNSYVQKGTTVAEILDTSLLEIQCSLHMKQIRWIWQSTNTEPEIALNAVSESTVLPELNAGSELNITSEFDALPETVTNVTHETTQNAPPASENGEDLSLLGGYVFQPIPVTIIYDIDGEKWAWEGKLRTLDGSGVNALTRMVTCRVVVDNPHNVKPYPENSSSSDNVKGILPTLLSGMFVSIIVHAKPEVTLCKIPEKALHPGNRIWTATGGKLKRHQLKVATTTPDGVLFYADEKSPTVYDLVVISPLAVPIEGGNVKVINDK